MYISRLLLIRPLTVLSTRKNVSYSAVCQSIGSTIGFIMVSTGLIVLNSKDFCNMFRTVPQEYGFVSCASELTPDGWLDILVFTLNQGCMSQALTTVSGGGGRFKYVA